MPKSKKNSKNDTKYKYPKEDKNENHLITNIIPKENININKNNNYSSSKLSKTE